MEFVKVMVLTRIGKYKNEVFSVVTFLRDRKVINSFDVYKIKLATFVYTKENCIIRTMKIRGLVYFFFN